MILFDVRASSILYNLLCSLDIKKKFLLPLNVCPIVPTTFIKANVSFEFIDISLDTLCMDENLLIEKLSRDENISGVLFVKTFGTQFDASKICKKIKEINSEIFIIDDCCLKIPDFDYDIENSSADMALFSTGYSKYIDMGWGGFGFLKDKYKYEKLKVIFKKEDLENFTKRVQVSIDTNTKLRYVDNLWLGDERVLYKNYEEYKQNISEKINPMINHKKSLNTIYESNLPKNIQLGSEYNNWRFSILVNDKKELLSKISDNNLFASSHYKEVDYMFKNDSLENSNAKAIHSKIVNLFNDFRFDEEKAKKVIEIVNKHINEVGNGY
jgi:dTDP-4-amino-4,6-dideoxygalactose transaminase